MLTPEVLVQIGMRAVIRDVQDYVSEVAPRGGQLDANQLRAFLMTLLITSGWEGFVGGES